MTAELYRLLIGQIFLQTCMNGMRLALPIYALNQGYSAAQAGVLLACLAVSNLVFAMPLGRMVDRRGLQFPWRLCVTAAVTSGLVCAALPNLWGMGVSAVLVGTSMGLSQMAAQRQSSLSAANLQQRSEVFGWMTLAPAAANMFGTLIVGFLLDHAGVVPSDRISLTVVCLFIITIALISMALVRDVAEKERPADAQWPAPKGAERATLSLLRDPGVRTVMVLNTLYFCFWNAFLLLVPVLAHERGLTSSTVGIIFAAWAIPAALVRPLLPRLTAGIAPTRLIGILKLLTAILLAALPYMWAPWAYIVCATLLGATMGSLQPLLITMLTHLAPHQRQGEALGLRLTSLSASQFGIPLLFGAGAALLNAALLFWGTAAVAVVGAWLALRVRAAAR